jgi:hypothetical protein
MAFSAKDAAGVTQSFDALGDGSGAPYRPRRATLDGDDVAQGATTDAAKTDQTAAGSVVSWLKGVVLLLKGTLTVAGSTTDGGPAQATSFGVAGAAVASADMTTAAAVTDLPAPGQKLVVTDFVVSSDTAMRFDFQEETTNTVVMSFYLTAGGPAQVTPRGKVKLATANKRLFGKASVPGNVRVIPVYYSEA